MNVHSHLDFLREQNRQLRDAMIGKRAGFPFEWGLTRAEEMILNSLYTSPNLKRTHEALLVVSRFSDDVGIKMIQVRIHNMRKKLNRHGIVINSNRGEGYELPKRSAEIIKAALA